MNYFPIKYTGTRNNETSNNKCISTLPGIPDVFFADCDKASKWNADAFLRDGVLRSSDGRCAESSDLGYGTKMQMGDCVKGAVGQQWYLSHDGNLRAKSTLNSANKGSIFDDGCIGKDPVDDTLMIDRSGFGKNQRWQGTDNSRSCESRFTWAMPADEPAILQHCDESIHGADLTRNCNYYNGNWETADGYNNNPYRNNPTNYENYTPMKSRLDYTPARASAARPPPVTEGYAPVGKFTPNVYPMQNCPVAGSKNKKCINVVSGDTVLPKQKIVCKQGYYGDDCEYFLDEDTVNTPIAYNANYTRTELKNAIAKEKCARGFDVNYKEYCDEQFPGVWDKVARDIRSQMDQDAQARFAKWGRYARPHNPQREPGDE